MILQIGGSVSGKYFSLLLNKHLDNSDPKDTDAFSIECVGSSIILNR